MISRRISSKAPAPVEGENRQQCVGCKIWSPSTNTNYTLISMQCGWRLARARDANGRAVMQWRCPDCWKKYRASTGEK